MISIFEYIFMSSWTVHAYVWNCAFSSCFPLETGTVSMTWAVINLNSPFCFVEPRLLTSVQLHARSCKLGGIYSSITMVNTIWNGESTKCVSVKQCMHETQVAVNNVHCCQIKIYYYWDNKYSFISTNASIVFIYWMYLMH